MQHGFNHVKLYPAGTRFYQSTHYPSDISAIIGEVSYSDNGNMETKNIATSAMRLDCSGMQCPGPIMKVFETMKAMQDGEVMEVSASDPGFARDIGAWCRRTGNILVSNEMLRLLDDLGRITEFDYSLMLRTLDRVETTPDEKLTFLFQSGIRITV